MYQDIYTIITDRLADLGITNVGPALGPEPALPAVQPYLARDREMDNTPSQRRMLTWELRVTVGHDDTTGNAQAEILDLLDTIRDGFCGWRPTVSAGVQGRFSVPEIRIEGFTDHGATVYAVVLELRVTPLTFAI